MTLLLGLWDFKVAAAVSLRYISYSSGWAGCNEISGDHLDLATSQCQRVRVTSAYRKSYFRTLLLFLESVLYSF